MTDDELKKAFDGLAKQIDDRTNGLDGRISKAIMSASNADSSARQAVVIGEENRASIGFLRVRVDTLETRVGASLPPPTDGVPPPKTLVGRLSMSEADVDALQGQVLALAGEVQKVKGHAEQQSKAMALPPVTESGEKVKRSVAELARDYFTSAKFRTDVVIFATAVAAVYSALTHALGASK